jgi:hypothetical protein
MLRENIVPRGTQKVYYIIMGDQTHGPNYVCEVKITKVLD